MSEQNLSEDFSSKEAQDRLESVGITLDRKERSGVFMQVDQAPRVLSGLQEGLEVMPLTEALEKHPWVEDLRWTLVEEDKDEYTRRIAEAEDVNGYFIRALPGAKVDIPVEACLYMREQDSTQKVHNILIAEEDSEINIISGCASDPHATSGMHIGVSEFFVRRGAKMSFTMIHRWDTGIEVRPRSASVVEEDGVFISNYVMMSPTKLVQMYPQANIGRDATAVFSNIVVVPEDSTVDIGSRGVLQEPGASVDMISRTISRGGDAIARGHIKAESDDVKGHLECRGLMLAEDGRIDAVPRIESTSPSVDLSHEAAIGRIAEEAIFYLMSRGLTRDEATASIIRGFLDIEIKGLPPSLKKSISQAIDSIKEDMI